MACSGDSSMSFVAPCVPHLYSPNGEPVLRSSGLPWLQFRSMAFWLSLVNAAAIESRSEASTIGSVWLLVKDGVLLALFTVLQAVSPQGIAFRIPHHPQLAFVALTGKRLETSLVKMTISAGFVVCMTIS